VSADYTEPHAQLCRQRTFHTTRATAVRMDPSEREQSTTRDHLCSSLDGSDACSPSRRWRALR
jgi:hypothetical protein